MNVDNAIAPNSPEYYRAAADYDGVILKAKQELSGLTNDNLGKWYLARCSEFFFVRARLYIASRAKNIKLTSTTNYTVSPIKIHKLIYRITSRLYVIRKVRKIHTELNENYKAFVDRLERAYNEGYGRAIDKNLYLAERLKILTSDILDDSGIFIEARLGSMRLARMNFDPILKSQYHPLYFGDTLANAQHFRQVLAHFEKNINKAPEFTIEVDANIQNDLTLKQVALLCIYQEIALTRAEADQMAANAGFTARTSGQKLMEHYNALAHHNIDRTGVDGRAIPEMIKAITGVIPRLPNDKRQQAEYELQLLMDKK